MRSLLRISAFMIFFLLSAPAWFVLGQTQNKISPERSDSGWGITHLMAALSQAGEGLARFREERHISFLNVPLISHGNLRFKSPDYLFKHTETPKDERLVVFKNEVTITSLEEGFQRTFSLEDYPQLRGLFDGIRFTLAGNLTGLNQSYEIDLQGAQELWQLHLIPKLQPMKEMVGKVTIFGSRAQLFKMEISESNGDFTVMFIEPLKQ